MHYEPSKASSAAANYALRIEIFLCRFPQNRYLYRQHKQKQTPKDAIIDRSKINTRRINNEKKIQVCNRMLDCHGFVMPDTDLLFVGTKLFFHEGVGQD